MNLINKELNKSLKFSDFLDCINKGYGPVEVSGLTSVSEASVVSTLIEDLKRPILYITYNEVEAKRLANDLRYFIDNVYFLPAKEIVTYDYVADSKNMPYERIEILSKLYHGHLGVFITTIEAIKQKLIASKTLFNNIIKINVGDIIKIEDLKEKLISLGYRRFDLIDGRGQFSVRGGIVDVSINGSIGIRIELWGDEIDSIRHFNIITQRSIDSLNKTSIYPAHEYLLENVLETVLNDIESRIYPEKQIDKINIDKEVILNGNYISKIERYFDSFYSEQECLLDYLNDDFLVCVDELSKIKQRSSSIDKDTENIISALVEKNKIVPDGLKNYNSLESIFNKINTKKLIYFNKLDDILKNGIKKFNFNYKELNYFKSGIELFIHDVENFKNNKKNTYILVDSKEKAEKIRIMLEENGITSFLYDDFNQTIINNECGKVSISVGNLSAGFFSFDLNQVVISANDMVEVQSRSKKRKIETYNNSQKIVYADLKVGDYVVHRKYGIGIFIGVNTIKADNIVRDYIKLKYFGDDILYVPTNALDEVRKYVGGDEIGLKLNKLGTRDWEKTTSRVRKNLRAVAKELIELYAKREKSKGYAFSKDCDFQRQFEGEFPYVETDDQLRCIEEVKQDMQNNKPMDRLLCGDVGYGKTEVAIRAAFKAVMDHKQVVYLTPTTVLAKQQYESFKSRMANFPIKVELLNRYRSTKDINRIIKELKLGDIDIVVATHKVLGKDVSFKDLGLLIIDEEHRFGVKDKEKIKEYKSSVDVLTMTATPIPRTLHMSVVGVRDMSVIYEPPQNRKPVQTYVLEYDEEVIKEAITKELERDGQVFYLFNNVEEIALKSDKISRLVPEARVGYAHGRMTGEEVDDVMNDFVEGKINILVCTTILESGIDIPNANTIIIENADRMGLAQLYQLRGRVGRSSTQGYAYITFRKDKILSEAADKRLKALKEFTEFGSGFKIAMRDLEIRGAGSLVGEIQHGHLEEVGYDTYCKILDDVLKEEQGIKADESEECQIDLNVTSFIPDSFISDQKQKIEIYQDIALCRNENDISQVVEEITDRFGNMPREIQNLLEITRIKNMAKQKYLIKIQSRKDSIVFTYENGKFDDNNINKLIMKYGNNIRFSSGIKPMVTLKLKKHGENELLHQVKEFLR